MIPFKYLILLTSFLFASAYAQSGQELNKKALYKDYLYLTNPLFGTQNPTAISYNLQEIADFDVSYLSRKGDFKQIGEGVEEHFWNGKIYGIKKIDKLSFEGGIAYTNARLEQKKWTNSLFVAADNPFFLSDSIASDVTSERFDLNGGFSYEVNQKWIVALRAIYNVGSLADQTDPRPKTKGMRFTLNPGINYRINTTFSLGASLHIGWLGESTTYIVINTNEPNVNTIFLQKGLGSPELKSAIGYNREYDGNSSGGNIQLLWNKQASWSNLFDLGYVNATEKAKDGGTEFDYKGGDYRATTLSLLDRISLQNAGTIHHLTFEALSKQIDGTWYIQTQSTDTDGNVLWTVRDKSIVHKESRLQAALNYRMDLMNGSTPHLSWSVGGKYMNSEITQYPELYKQKYSLMLFEGRIAKHLHVGKGLMSLLLHGDYTHNLSDQINVSGSKLALSYLQPAFQAISGSSYSTGLFVSYKIPMNISNSPFILGLSADASLRKYNDQYTYYKGTNRKILHVGVNVVF